MVIKFITINQSDIDNRVYENASVKEDLFEAILGAVAIDCNWDMKELTHVVDQMLQPNLSEEDVNYISELQSWSQKKYGVLPVYDMKPYNTAHWYIPGFIYDMSRNYHLSVNPAYIAYLKVNGVQETILGFGNTQSEARQDVARYALKILEDRDLLFSMNDEIENPSRDMAINQLEILSRRGYFVLPEYSFEETYDDDGNPVWSCTVSIPETSVKFLAESSSKKDAKSVSASFRTAPSASSILSLAYRSRISILLTVQGFFSSAFSHFSYCPAASSLPNSVFFAYSAARPASAGQ